MTKFYVKPTPDDQWSVTDAPNSMPLDSFDSKCRAEFWAEKLNWAFAEGAKSKTDVPLTAAPPHALLQRASGALISGLSLTDDVVTVYAGTRAWREHAAEWSEAACNLVKEIGAVLATKNPVPDAPGIQNPIAIKLLDELRTWLDQQLITGENIGGIRSQCFVPWDSTWNTIVREETAKREKFIPIVHIREKKESEPSPAPTVQPRDLPKESLPEFGKEVKQQQPMTATEFPMKELVSWIVELHTTLLTNVGLTPGTRDALDKALLEYQKAAHEKGLL